ncbi:DUF2332 domain-containing protein [Actinomycetospora aeridis]|uniref:DUF2332 domain-containing protein n=1 Tax=Actinomycetospora aeridis TaxID=3129231 RepID=A0ABU8NB15_9PSEU
MGRPRTLAERYRHFGEVEIAETSPLYARIAVALSESDAAMRAVESAPACRRAPALVLAALHDLALAGRAPALTRADAAVETLRTMTDAVVDIVTRRRHRPDETARATVLHPTVAEAAHRVGAAAIGLVDVGCGAAFDLGVDRVGITYDDGRTLGDASSPVQQSATVVGDRPVPTLAIPEVVARVGVDRDPLDVTDADDARWLRACLAPDQHERAARLDAEIALARATPRVLLRGDPLDLLPDALARVPDGALPVVTTTWALSAFSLEQRRVFLERLQQARRPVAWVSVEGVGVAPSIPTPGDRPASGHSLLGLATNDGPAPTVLGRCWSRGRLLSWLAAPR